MASAQAPAGQPRAHAASPLRRPLDRALLGGVCAGLADRMGVEVLVVRVMAVMAATVGGLGVAAYAMAWALIPATPDSTRSGRRPGAWRQAPLVVFTVAALFAGVHLAGSHLGEGLWPLVLGVCGMALLWRPAVVGNDPLERRRPTLREYLNRPAQVGAPRLIAGGLFVAFGAAALLHAVGVQHSIGKAIWAVAIIGLVVGMVVGPWVMRLGTSLSFERAARIREQERAEVAAHLHDSVLQTLALIQKRAGDPRQVAGLARRQERELRSWLLKRPGEAEEDSVAVALERAAAEVEELHGVPIEVVTVGDVPLSGGLEAVVQAAREAMTNAAKFAGSERVDLYAEVEDDRVEVFVRDRGVGFDIDEIPDDRRGVRDSIIARMERHHGRAAVNSSPGKGTEVELVMERTE
ncbi:MAG: PspC domain-containing protein [Solirubrobacteraceae bacterium]|jgi:signal transduction histidine kinase/phage shock protein PspC (stress-responsive transcriptional regulator)